MVMIRKFSLLIACIGHFLLTLAGMYGLKILIGTQPVEWPFNPLHLPIYAAYIAFCIFGVIFFSKRVEIKIDPETKQNN